MYERRRISSNHTLPVYRRFFYYFFFFFSVNRRYPTTCGKSIRSINVLTTAVTSNVTQRTKRRWDKVTGRTVMSVSPTRKKFAENGMLSLTAPWITSCVTRSLNISEKLENFEIVCVPPPPPPKTILTNLHNVINSPLEFGSAFNHTDIKNFTPPHKTKTNLEIYSCKHFKIIYVNKLSSRRIIPFASTL